LFKRTPISAVRLLELRGDNLFYYLCNTLGVLVDISLSEMSSPIYVYFMSSRGSDFTMVIVFGCNVGITSFMP
jgi:hypothetical protein